MMGKHGLVTWGETSKESYDNTIRILIEAEAYLKTKSLEQPFGAQVVEPVSETERSSLLPVLRSAMSGARAAVLSVDSSPEVLEFVGGADAAALSQVSAACPDHLVHTKRIPLFLNWTPANGESTLLEIEAGTGRALVRSSFPLERYEPTGERNG